MRQEICLPLMVLLCCSGCGMSKQTDIDINLTDPRKVAMSRTFSGSIVSLKIYRISSSRGIDSYRSIENLLAMEPLVQISDHNKITDSLNALGDFNTNVWQTKTGDTYHLLFFYENTNSVMHFRIFTTNINDGGAMIVYPRSDTSFIYSSQNAGDWLRNSLRKQTIEKDLAK